MNCCTMKIPIWATQNKQRGRMQPAGHHFDIGGSKFLGWLWLNLDIFRIL